MKIITKEINFTTEGNSDIINITDSVREKLNETRLVNGNCTVFAVGSTASVTTIEYEPGLIKDLPKLLDKLIPSIGKYHHDETWGDGNGHAHLRSSVIGTSFCVPFSDRQLILGTWQQIIFIDFDNRKRTRKVILQFMGE